jgi:uncharacterized membrane protein HdeD (DUF308 family)
MLKEVTRNWWAVALRGLAGVLFGIGAFIWPDITLTALVLLFGAYALVDGGFALFNAFASGKPFRGMGVIEGLAGIAIGIIALAWPGTTALALIYLIAAWAVITGILEILAAIELRKLIENEWMLGLGGLASVAFGVLMALQPGAGGLALTWLIGAYALIFGALLIALGFRLRAVDQEINAHGGGQPRETGAPIRA